MRFLGRTRQAREHKADAVVGAPAFTWTGAKIYWPSIIGILRTINTRKVPSDNGLGLFVRSMVGLGRETAKRAFDGFLTGKVLTANQIQFVSLVVDYLTQAGWMSP